MKLSVAPIILLTVQVAAFAQSNSKCIPITWVARQEAAKRC